MDRTDHSCAVSVNKCAEVRMLVRRLKDQIGRAKEEQKSVAESADKIKAIVGMFKV